MNFFTSLAQLRNGFCGPAKNADGHPLDTTREEEPFLSVDDFDLPEPMQRAISKMSADTDAQLEPAEDAHENLDADLDDDLDMSAELDAASELEMAIADAHIVHEADAAYLPEPAADQTDAMSLMARVARAAELTEESEPVAQDTSEVELTEEPEAIAQDAPEAELTEEPEPMAQDAPDADKAEVVEDVFDMVLDAVDAEPVIQCLTIDDFDVTRDSIDIEIQRDPSDPRVLDATEMTLFQAEDGTTGADVVFHLCGEGTIPEVCATVRLLSKDVINLDDIEITITEVVS